ncbi:type I-E CRISPR-associated protein Cas6/Cse3/CasE [Paenibacillus ginsengihumi]|uniref:type I-E CRISPR-associated protein Cas6/Cse3/CasE n=1 Tax=Paenibacillus ginsengihumi TaxID=431596 RepID=UPI00035DEFE8|nr:type I-E CRISPR-associated protein Cas6/Cse3/CasE [Paenibacillus ginsengihumi]
MYLSRVILNDRKRDTQRALASPQIIHGAVESSFPRNGSRPESARKRLLWRVDYVADKCCLLLLSEDRPDLTSLIQQFGYPDVQPQGETKAYAPFLDKLRNGQRWQFRLRANPVRSSAREADERTGRGKVFAHVTPEQQKQWLMARAEGCGFAVKPEEFNVVHTDWKTFRKATQGQHRVVLRTATFEGVLSITDAERFRLALTSGIGRAKAYGCGLMTIMPIAGG